MNINDVTNRLGSANAWAVALTIGVFLAGLLVGVLIPGSSGRAPAPSPPPFLMEEVLSELDLTPAQRSEIDRIVGEQSRTVNEVMRSVTARLDAAVDSARDEIREQLSSTQLSAFDSVLAQREDELRGSLRRRQPAPTGTQPPGA